MTMLKLTTQHWLKALEDIMRDTVRWYMKQAIDEYPKVNTKYLLHNRD